MYFYIVKSNAMSIESQIKRFQGELPEGVKLLAVSKFHPVEAIVEAYEAGQRAFGESRPQELKQKYEVLPHDIEWHMIGHLQRNKVKYLMGKVALIHSVDSLRLAQEISKEAGKHGTIEDILVEINVAEEESKFGITTEEAIDLVSEIAKLPNLHVKGLMTIAPFVADPEENREVFRALKKLSVDIKAKNVIYFS